MTNDKPQFVNLGVYSSTRARLNLFKAMLEAERKESVTTDQIVNELLDKAGVISAGITEHAQPVNA